MRRSIAQISLLLLGLAVLVACGDQSLFMSLKNDAADLQINSISDGQVITSGSGVPLMIAAESSGKGKDVEIEVTLTSAAGQSVWHNRSAATVNEQIPIALPPDIAVGMYKLDLVLYSAGEVVQKKSASFFVAGSGWKITGIKSFPPVITAAASVMLKAELQIPANTDAYLRWSWKGKVIAKGALSKGFGQILWTAPSDVGVYTITLELFPSLPPAGTDFSFTSSLSLSTDIFVSTGKNLAMGDFGPEASYLSLLHLQANLADAGAGAKRLGKPQALPIGSPEIVSLEDGFGYRLNGSTGIQIPWLTLPTSGGALRPFTVSIDLSFDDIGSANTIFSTSTSDNSTSLVISLDPGTHMPQARFQAGGLSGVSIPWSGPSLAANQRYLLSLSIVPQGSVVSAQWFLDGTQVGQTSVASATPTVSQDGTTVIGGEKGFKGTVDEFGVYYLDAAGRPAPDPDQFLRGQSVKFGASLMLANGFDGIFLPDGYSLEGSGQLAVGFLTLAPGAMLDIPPMKIGGSDVTVTTTLGASSSLSAALLLQWEGGSQPPLQVPLTADGSRVLKFRVGADGQALLVQTGGAEKTVMLPKAPASGASLIVKIGAPTDASSPLVLDSLLAVKERK